MEFATPTFTDDAVRERLREFTDGTRIEIQFYHIRDLSNLRTLRGSLHKSGDHWQLRTSATQKFKLPSTDTVITSIEPLARSRARSISQARSEDLGEAFDRPHAPAPAATATPAAVSPPAVALPVPSQLDPMTMFTMMMSIQAKQMQEITNLFKHQREETTQLHRERPPQPLPGSEVNNMFMLSDALRGQDNPTWRLVPGLILPRFLSERFQIVSIPHLIFKEDPVTGEMVKVPKGTALLYYKSILATSKMQFPNQIPIKSQQSGKNDPSMDIGAGVRASLERAERMFTDLLTRLDLVDPKDLPSSKQEWLIFIDAGVSVLEHYSTLSNGFVRGGGKIAQAYAVAIAQGKFDPSKLWQHEGNSFRE